MWLLKSRSCRFLCFLRRIYDPMYLYLRHGMHTQYSDPSIIVDCRPTVRKNTKTGRITSPRCSGHDLDPFACVEITCYSSQHVLAHGRSSTNLGSLRHLRFGLYKTHHIRGVLCSWHLHIMVFLRCQVSIGKVDDSFPRKLQPQGLSLRDMDS